MIDVRTIQELYRYNRWANARVLEAVASVTQQQFLKDLGGSYPSIRDTLTHIVWGEWLYLKRWNGTSPRTVFQGTDFPQLNSLRTRWREVEGEQRAYVEAATTEGLQSMVPYVNLQGQTWQYPLWRQLYHVVNHSSYHRGQVSMMLRQSGAQPAATDFLLFHDEVDAGVA